MKEDYKLLTDAQLTDKLDQRDHDAFEEIYRRYWPVLYNFARKMLQDNEQAKDIVQDAFTKLYAQIGILNFQEVKIAPYLYTLIRNANLSRKEIAESTQLSEETVKKQIYNALKILRSKLKAYFF